MLFQFSPLLRLPRVRLVSRIPTTIYFKPFTNCHHPEIHNARRDELTIGNEGAIEVSTLNVLDPAEEAAIESSKVRRGEPLLHHGPPDDTTVDPGPEGVREADDGIRRIISILPGSPQVSKKLHNFCPRPRHQKAKPYRYNGRRTRIFS